MKSKINYPSRYYDPFMHLRGIASAYQLFGRIYNEDKKTYIAAYYFDDYKDTLSPETAVSFTIQQILKYLEENLYNNEEKNLLLSELTPFIKIYGSSNINDIENRINLFNRYGKPEKDAASIDELKKSIEKLKLININLNEEFGKLINSINSDVIPVKYNQQDIVISLEALASIKKKHWQKLFWGSSEHESVNAIVFEIVLNFFGKTSEMNQEYIAITSHQNETQAKAFVDKLIMKLGFLANEVPNKGSENSLINSLHPKVRKICQKLYANEHYADAVSQAFKLVINEIKDKYPGNGDGTMLMDKVFSKNNPLNRFSADASYQEGMMYLYKGMVLGIRNRYQHENIELNDPIYTIELLQFASMLVRLIENPSIY